MFLILKNFNDLSCLVLDTSDGVVERVSSDDLIRAKSYGFKFREDDSLKDYAYCYKSLSKASILNTLDDVTLRRDLYEKLKLWGSYIKDLPKLKDYMGFDIRILYCGQYFACIINEAVDSVLDSGDAYLYIIKENEISCKVYKQSYIEVSDNNVVSVSSLTDFGIIVLDLLNNPIVTFNEKTAKRKRGRLSDVFASVLDKI